MQTTGDPYALAGPSQLTVQIHDHTVTAAGGAQIAELEAYRDAGYDFVLFGGYSGKPTLPDSLNYRPDPAVHLTPAERAALLPLDYLRGGEEVGDQHVTSAGSHTYIEIGTDYENTQGCIELVNADGGFSCLAHPYGYRYLYDGWAFYHGIEIHSAYMLANPGAGTESNADKMRRQVDEILSLGMVRPLLAAVNDHYGPAKLGTHPAAADSGYCVVLADGATEADVVAALKRGSFYAVRDEGTPRHAWPASIVCEQVDANTLRAVATGGVTKWIAQGVEYAGETLDLRSLPKSARYARAEITIGAVVVFCQPYFLEPTS